MNSDRVDVHAHFLPGGYRSAVMAAGHAQPDGFPRLPEWSTVEHVGAMDRLGIATSLLSISSPAVHFGDDAAACALAREVNEDGNRAVVDHPGRSGLFAALPTPDIEFIVSHVDVPRQLDAILALTTLEHPDSCSRGSDRPRNR